MFSMQRPVNSACSAIVINYPHKTINKYFCGQTMFNQVKGDLKQIFLSAVNAVQAAEIFCPSNFQLNECESKILCNFNDTKLTIDIDGDKRCHLVGFGKAVFGMTHAISKILGDRLKSGIISVPFGTIEKFQPSMQLPPSTEVYEGAKNNLPDRSAENAARKIVDFVQRLTKDDVLFVLISGGGSALLPLPCAGVSLKEKCDIITQLASKGATINDINRVRIDLSQTKGGKLAQCTKNAISVIAFIISDIIGDPIDLIASGPTHVSNTINKITSIDVLERYHLWNTLPHHVQQAIMKNSKSNTDSPENVHNFIVANNEKAANAALAESERRNINAIILSTEIDGNVEQLSEAYANFAKYIKLFKRNEITKNELKTNILTLKNVLRIRNEFFDGIDNIVKPFGGHSEEFCVIGSGEPTVQITGNGLGGRNQELALRFSQRCIHDELLHDVLLLSAGTDGIDGPTTAAGAIGGAAIVKEFLTLPGKQLSDIDAFIRANDSFNFYSNLRNGEYHIVTGHTGTNVMDLHLLYFTK